MFSDLGKDFTWLQRHERIVIVALVLTVAAFGINKWLDKSAIEASNKAAVAQQIASVQHDADQKIAAAVAQQTALFNQEQAAREQEMASLVAAVASRDAASTQKITVVSQPKTTPQAVADINSVYTLPTPLTVEEAGLIPIADLQQFTIAKIQGDTAQADLADTRKELATTTASLSSATGLVGALQNQVTGLNTELKDVTAAKDAEIKAVKTAARKSKRNWFIAGLITGFGLRVATGH